MKVLAIGQIPHGVDRADVARYQQAELRRAWQLYSDGVIREMYTRADAPNVVMMLETPDLEQARVAVDSLPMVAGGALTLAGLTGSAVYRLGRRRRRNDWLRERNAWQDAGRACQPRERTM